MSLLSISAILPNTLKFCTNGNVISNFVICNKRSISKSPVSFIFDSRDKGHEEKCKALIVREGEYFDELCGDVKNKETFKEVLKVYNKRNPVHKRGHVEFIYAALIKMEEFKSNRDIEIYKELIQIFPKYVMKPKNVWQIEFMHFPKQQQCGIHLLDQMERNGITPDDDIGYNLIDRFGDKSHIFRKYQRMMYWMPKFKNANPYFVPYDLPECAIEIAKLALNRMKVDLENEISVYQTEELHQSTDKTFVVSAQSPDQRKLLGNLPDDEILYVEGAHSTWLRATQLYYFVLRCNNTKSYKEFIKNHKKFDYKNVDEKEELKLYTYDFDHRDYNAVARRPSIHEQEEGIILGMCITGTSSKDSLASWIKFLEKSNPRLSDLPVVFLARSPGNELDLIGKKEEEKKSTDSKNV